MTSWVADPGVAGGRGNAVDAGGSDVDRTGVEYDSCCGVSYLCGDRPTGGVGFSRPEDAAVGRCGDCGGRPGFHLPGSDAHVADHSTRRRVDRREAVGGRYPDETPSRCDTGPDLLGDLLGEVHGPDDREGCGVERFDCTWGSWGADSGPEVPVGESDAVQPGDPR